MRSFMLGTAYYACNARDQHLKFAHSMYLSKLPQMPPKYAEREYELAREKSFSEAIQVKEHLAALRIEDKK